MKKAPAAGADDVSTTMLGDWFATPLMWRPQAVLLVNTATFLPVLAPLAPAAKLLDRVPGAIAAVLQAHGVDDNVIATELDAMAEVRLTSTNNRQVVGVMTEFTFHAQHRWPGEKPDLVMMAMELANLPLGPLGYKSAAEQLGATISGEALAIKQPKSRRNVISLADRRAERDANTAASVRQFKVTLNGSKPPIWRRVVVDGEQPLQHLHEVIQAAFGWFNCHLHEFEVGDRSYGVPHEDDFKPVGDERKVTINKALGSHQKLRYIYDFGDYWVHDIAVEPVTDPSPAVPACVGGKRACPPEDCGGMWGYKELLTILGDPNHPEHRERSEWIANPIDPEAFNPGDFEENLKLARTLGHDLFE